MAVQMIPKIEEKETAVKLRKEGFSYNEILKRVPVAKSTLSLWLRNVGLAKKQKQKLTQKRNLARLKAIKTIRNRRILLEKKIIEEEAGKIGKLNKRDLWLLGIALYWAEGKKQKANDVSARISLGNTDPKIIKLFLKWLYTIFKIKSDDIEVRLYIHETGNVRRAKTYWSNIIKIPTSKFKKTVLKKHNIKTNRRFDKDKYFGLCNINLKKSTNLNRKIAGWIKGISKNI